MNQGEISIIPILDVPQINPGDPIADVISARFNFLDFDVLVVTQKIVSKAENRIVKLDLNSDLELQLQELIENESKRILRRRGNLYITETHTGYICANAGIDHSNVSEGFVTLLPLDPDRSARRIRDRIRATQRVELGVIISDTFGRTWRRGVTDVALGTAGISAIVDLRGTSDSLGRMLNATEIALCDEIAGAAELVKPKNGNIPAVVIRGLPQKHFRESSVLEEVIRPYSEDLFR